MIEAFLFWWLQQLAACLPPALRPGREKRDGTTVEPLPDGAVRVIPRRAGGRRSGPGTGGTPVTVAPGPAMADELRAALGSRPGPVTLLLPPEAMLRRPVELPLAAERNLGSVLRYEMDRLTPFAADEVDWTWSVRERDRARDRVRLELRLIPRALAAPVRDALNRAGHPVAVLANGVDAIVPGPADADVRGRGWRRGLLVAQAALCAVLLLAVVVLPFARQSLQARRVERQIAALQPAVDRAEALRRRIAAGTAGADVLAAQEAASGQALAVVALVTDVLPDGTYLSAFGWRNRQMTLEGQSAAAPQLIQALSRDPAIRNPVFTAPVTHDEAARVDRFSIRAELAP